MHTKRKRQKPAAPAAPQPVVTFDAAVEKLYLDTRTAAAQLGLEVIMVVASPAGEWRAKWGQMNPDQVTLLVFKLLTKLQSMFP